MEKLLIGRNFSTDRDMEMVFTYFPLKIQLPTTFETQKFQKFWPKSFWRFYEHIFASGAPGRKLFF